MNEPEPAQPAFPSAFRVTWLIARLQLRRLLNRFSVLRPEPAATTQRRAVPRKHELRRLLLALFGVAFAVQAVQSSALILSRIARGAERAEHQRQVIISPDAYASLDIASGEERENLLAEVIEQDVARLSNDEAREKRRAFLRERFARRGVRAFHPSTIPDDIAWPDERLWYAGEDGRAMLRPLSLVAALLGLALVLVLVASAEQDLSKVAATFEWLFSFPVRARSLFLARALAVVFSGSVWLLPFPFYTVVFWCAGLGAWSVPLAALASLYLAVMGGGLKVMLETTLRQYLSPAAVSRVQAALVVTSFLALLATFTLGLSPRADAFFERFGALPDIVSYLPLALPLRLSLGGEPALVSASVALVTSVLWLSAAVALAERMVKNGVATAATAHVGRRLARPIVTAEAATMTAAGVSAAARSPEPLFTPSSPERAAPIQRRLTRGVVLKELRVVLRDRRLFAQAFVLPGLLFVAQLWLDPSAIRFLLANPRHIATAAFGSAALALMTGASHALATEGPALWMLYTAPERLERLLLHKLWVWVAIAYLFAALVFGLAWLSEPHTFVPTLPYAAIALVGIYLYGIIAFGIGALGTDALEPEPRRRMRSGALYLFMLLATLYGYAIIVPSLWAKVVQLALSALLAFALWQKLEEHLPFLLDPTAAPPPSIAVADGVVAALGFFVLQGVLVVTFEALGALDANAILAAFVAAGSIVTLLAVYVFRRTGVPHLAAALGLRRQTDDPRATLRHVALGVLAGFAATVIAVAYLQLAEYLPWLERMLEEAPNVLPEELSGEPSLEFMALAVLAAPIFEEFIFRGILYRGLRRSLRPLMAALASAVVFALVHPQVAAVPVFAMAFFSALAYERTGWLGTPVVAHMTYNGLVVVGAWE